MVIYIYLVYSMSDECMQSKIIQNITVILNGNLCGLLEDVDKQFRILIKILRLKKLQIFKRVMLRAPTNVAHDVVTNAWVRSQCDINTSCATCVGAQSRCP